MAQNNLSNYSGTLCRIMTGYNVFSSNYSNLCMTGYNLVNYTVYLSGISQFITGSYSGGGSAYKSQKYIVQIISYKGAGSDVLDKVYGSFERAHKSFKEYVEMHFPNWEEEVVLNNGDMEKGQFYTKDYSVEIVELEEEY